MGPGGSGRPGRGSSGLCFLQKAESWSSDCPPQAILLGPRGTWGVGRPAARPSFSSPLFFKGCLLACWLATLSLSRTFSGFRTPNQEASLNSSASTKGPGLLGLQGTGAGVPGEQCCPLLCPCPGLGRPCSKTLQINRLQAGQVHQKPKAPDPGHRTSPPKKDTDT